MSNINWEERFDEKFKYFSGHEMLQTHQGHDIVKSFSIDRNYGATF